MTVSILMPTYNRGKLIYNSILAILKQTYEDWELIIKDGGTEKVANLIPDDERITYIWNKDDGITDALNQAYDIANGHICCWANDDDLLAPNALQVAINAFESSWKQVSMNYYEPTMWVYGQILMTTNPEYAGKDDEHAKVYGEPWDFTKLKQYNYVPQPAVFWDMSLRDRIGMFAETYDLVSDYEYWLHIGALYEPVFIPEIMAYYRLHPGQITAYDNPNQAAQAEQVKKLYKAVEPSYGV